VKSAPPSRAPLTTSTSDALAKAKAAERAGKRDEAATVLEDAAATSRDSRARAKMLVRAVQLRLGSENSSRDLGKVQALLEDLERSAPAQEIAVPGRDLLRVLNQMSGLRAEIRGLRTEKKALETEVAKKNEALRRVTSAVVGAGALPR
jgi:hypothetical protein